MIVEHSKVTLSQLGVEGIGRLEVDSSDEGRVYPFDEYENTIAPLWTIQEVSNLIEALEKAREIMDGTPAPARPLLPSKEGELRALASAWGDSEIGYPYGQTVLDILNG